MAKNAVDILIKRYNEKIARFTRNYSEYIIRDPYYFSEDEKFDLDYITNEIEDARFDVYMDFLEYEEDLEVESIEQISESEYKLIISSDYLLSRDASIAFVNKIEDNLGITLELVKHYLKQYKN